MNLIKTVESNNHFGIVDQMIVNATGISLKDILLKNEEQLEHEKDLFPLLEMSNEDKKEQLKILKTSNQMGKIFRTIPGLNDDYIEKNAVTQEQLLDVARYQIMPANYWMKQNLTASLYEAIMQHQELNESQRYELTSEFQKNESPALNQAKNQWALDMINDKKLEIGFDSIGNTIKDFSQKEVDILTVLTKFI